MWFGTIGFSDLLLLLFLSLVILAVAAVAVHIGAQNVASDSAAAQTSSDTWTLTVVSIRTIVHTAAAASVTARISKNICPYTQTQTTSAVNCVARHSGITGKWKLTWQKNMLQPNRELVIGLSNGECMSSLPNMCVRGCSLIQDAYCYLFIWYSVF